MSFGRAFRPTTPRKDAAPRDRPLSAAQLQSAAASAAAAAAEENTRQQWADALFGGKVSNPPRSRFSVGTDPASLAALAAARAAATSHAIGEGGGAAIDRTYSATHNQPFNGLKHVRTARWESPLTDPNLSLRRLALAGVERPDLAAENRAHALAAEREEALRKEDANRALFLFREAQLGALHARKRERVDLETRSSLRPGPSDQQSPTFLDAPQFQPLAVPPPEVEPWYSAHHLQRDLTKHPWVTDSHRAARAVRAIEARASIEAQTTRAEREAKALRIRAVREREDRLRAANQSRDALIANTFSHVERAPQNLDAHLSYLTSSRCAPRPLAAMPPNLEPERLLPPNVHNKAAHIAHAGWTSLKTKINYRVKGEPAGIRARAAYDSARGGASTARSYTSQSRRGSTRRGSAHAAFTARYAPPSQLGSPRARPAPEVAVPVAEGVAVLHPPSGARRAEHSGLTAFADSLADPEPSPSVSTGGGLTSASFRASFANAVKQEHGRTASTTLSEDESAFLTDLASSPRAHMPSAAPVLSPRSQAWTGELELSPRSNARLGQMIRPAHPPQASPRVEALAKPLARLQHVKEVGRDHRDFNGLLEQLPVEMRQMPGSKGREEEEEKQQTPVSASYPTQPQPQSQAGVRPLSALSSRPSTARSRFVRESIGVASPPATSPRYDSEYAPPRQLQQQQQHSTAATARGQEEQREERQENEESDRGDARAEQQQPQQHPSAQHPAFIPRRPGSSASTIVRPVSSCSTLSARGSRLQHPTDAEQLPMWNRTNRLQHLVAHA